ncbi:hypothetical protein EV683_11930 [Crenobacter luteus]|uniref:HugZ family pyridoxamine 5'-phosphate oxidase n=1 Tax=Crenobacter luteus TaxID=1452487 RepID=UPI001044D6D0|nr:pyridoxamine 5'-phosphate oxidase family protein [Crenobacter luteus]TCP10751.1 hypothetical protein EV683_11930 [Crenobacter luteus]
MKLPLASAIDLVHRADHGALASHATQLPGYPFCTQLPFVPDAQHRPVLLISSLAEHTRNLIADGRASLALADPGADDLLSGARLTLLGDVARVDADEALVARYLRYRPEAADYLGFGDFAFYRLEPRRVRLIAGFARMGWLEAEDWAGAVTLTPDDEAAELAALPMLAGARWLGLDAYGADIERDGRRLRLTFAEPAADAQERRRAVAVALAAQGS